jgi:hypothetical protein
MAEAKARKIIRYAMRFIGKMGPLQASQPGVAIRVT